MKIELLRARNTGDFEPPKLEIQVVEQVPTNMDLVEAKTLYQMQARSLADALFKTLPGGTIDALLCEMLSRKASLLNVRYQE